MEVTNIKADIKVMADINHAKDTTKVTDNKINVNVTPRIRSKCEIQS